MSKAFRHILCFFGFHKWSQYASQIFCINEPSDDPLEFVTRRYYQCGCGLSRGEWSKSFFNDGRLKPWTQPEFTKGMQGEE